MGGELMGHMVEGGHAQPDLQIDQAELERQAKLANEAAERVNFHRCELERWERVGRAAVGAMETLQATVPLEHTDPGDWSTHKTVSPMAGSPVG